MPARNPSLNGAVSMLTAAFFFTAMAVSMKLIGPETTLWHVAMARFGIGALAVWGLVRIFRQNLWGNNRRLLFLRGLMGTTAGVCQFQAILTLPLAAALVLFFTFPIFAAILSPWINQERTPCGDWVLIILAVIGTALILWPSDLRLGFDHNYIFPITGAFFAGAATSLIRKLRADNSPMTLYFYLCLVGSLVCLGPVLAQESTLIPDHKTLWGLLLTALLAMIAQLAMNHGFKFLSAPRGGVLMMSQIVMGALAGVIFFKEPLQLKFVAGALLIGLSGIMLTLRPSLKKMILK